MLAGSVQRCRASSGNTEMASGGLLERVRNTVICSGRGLSGSHPVNLEWAEQRDRWEGGEWQGHGWVMGEQLGLDCPLGMPPPWSLPSRKYWHVVWTLWWIMLDLVPGSLFSVGPSFSHGLHSTSPPPWSQGGPGSVFEWPLSPLFLQLTSHLWECFCQFSSFPEPCL